MSATAGPRTSACAVRDFRSTRALLSVLALMLCLRLLFIPAEGFASCQQRQQSGHGKLVDWQNLYFYSTTSLGSANDLAGDVIGTDVMVRMVSDYGVLPNVHQVPLMFGRS